MVFELVCMLQSSVYVYSNSEAGVVAVAIALPVIRRTGVAKPLIFLEIIVVIAVSIVLLPEFARVVVKPSPINYC